MGAFVKQSDHLFIMKIFLAIFACFLGFVYADEIPSLKMQCPPPYRPIGKSCYYYEGDIKKNFNDARDDCILKNGELVSITDCEEHDHVQEFLTIQGVPYDEDFHL